MDVYEALYTTRAMRRVRPDPIPEDVQARILDAAIRAPSGGNAQKWRFLLVDDPEIRNQLGPIYRRCLTQLLDGHYKPMMDKARANPDDPRSVESLNMYRSSKHMGEHFEKYPLLLFGFDQGDPTGASIFPAVWSAMLAARAEGVGSTITTLLLLEIEPVLELLGVPTGEGWRFTCCIPMGYPTGRWGVARRKPVEQVTFKNRWGEPLDIDIGGPLWNG